jgi:protein-tyrosine phosphatase
MTSTDESVLAVDGCCNFRDAGGWPLVNGSSMRRDVLYRSDDPIRLTDQGRQAVAALGLSAVVDLRQHAQFVRTPGFVSAERTFHRPLVDRVIDLDNPPPLSVPEHIADVYDDMVDRSVEQIGDVLDIVGRHVTTGPVLVHCAFGKDRTGLVIALVQAAIGVEPERIADDYARSHQPSARRLDWMLTEPLDGDPPLHRPPRYLFAAPRRTMEVVLQRATQRHGSLLDWVRSFPISADTVTQLRRALVDK